MWGDLVAREQIGGEKNTMKTGRSRKQLIGTIIGVAAALVVLIVLTRL